MYNKGISNLYVVYSAQDLLPEAPQNLSRTPYRNEDIQQQNKKDTEDAVLRPPYPTEIKVFQCCVGGKRYSMVIYIKVCLSFM